MTLTKSGIVTAIQSENGYSLQKATDIVETLIEIIKSTLISGNDVMISGFGLSRISKMNNLYLIYMVSFYAC